MNESIDVRPPTHLFNRRRMLAALAALGVSPIGCAAPTGALGLQGTQNSTPVTSFNVAEAAKLADENQVFTLAAPATVYYGANGVFSATALTAGTYSASNAQFGGDPLPYVVKAAYVSFVVATASRIAFESDTFTLTAPTMVYYGANGKFRAKVLTAGTYGATNTLFGGDPLPYVYKAAYIAAAAPAIAKRPPLGVYIGNNPAQMQNFENWLGYPADQILTFTDPFQWSSIAYPNWFVNLFAAINRPAIWSFAMIPQNGTLESVAGGQHDADYRSAASILENARPHADGFIYIRLGWEFNGNWFPWSAAGHEAAFISAFQHVVTSFRSVSNKFRFEWNMNYGQTMNPETAFPGAAFVDVIGMDFYWMPQYIGSDPIAAFNTIASDRYGLRYLDTLAAKYNKPIAFSEWGVTGNNAAPYINAVHDWMGTRNVAYHNYWDSNSAYPGMLSNNAWPASGQAFRSAFAPTR